MAAFRWMTALPDPDASLASWFAPIAQSLGLEVLAAVSSHAQLYAVAPLADLSQKTSPVVTVLISWADAGSRQVLIEVRSDESMLRSYTRCELIAQRLKRVVSGC